MLRGHLLKVKQPMSTTISRFTPPTCTLEIKGKKSPLSGWTNQDILHKFQFKLRFDDPREPTSKQVTVKGNERDFKQLATAIDLYVKEYLASSFKDNLESVAEFKGDRPAVKAQGLVNHELFLGSLTHNGNNNKIALSTVQLFDLVTALEAFKSHLATLPDRAKSRKNLPLWGAIAAVAIAAISITGILIRSSSQQNIASSPETRSESPTEIPELNEVVPPQQPDCNKQPKSQPKLNDPLSSAKRLPPPPAVDTPKPKPNIPDSADYPLSDIARQSGFDNLAKSETETSVAIPAEPSETTENIAEPQTTLESEVDATQNDSSASPTQARSDIALNPASQTSQIQQVTAYFQEKWQPPAELNQSLEYRLVLNPNGTIGRVTPIGKASALYLSKTSIPLNGEPFISPSQVQAATVRLLLSPDGRVRAFAE